MSRNTREIAWIKAARKEFGKFPVPAQRTMARALTIAAESGKADIAKPMKGLGSGVFEVALAYRSDAYRVVYAVQIDEAVWVCPCLPEEIDHRHQDAAAGHRPDP